MRINAILTGPVGINSVFMGRSKKYRSQYGYRIFDLDIFSNWDIPVAGNRNRTVAVVGHGRISYSSKTADGTG